MALVGAGLASSWRAWRRVASRRRWRGVVVAWRGVSVGSVA
ncbi:hypothetical protein ACXZ9C_11485 [Streptococcus agalactiae]